MGRREQLFRILQTTRLRGILESRSRWQGMVVLNYHRFGEPSGTLLDRGVFSATQDEFDAQLTMLGRETEIIDPDDLGDVLARPTGRYSLVTLDDGYRDNHTHALPVLSHHRVRALLFIATGFVGTNRLPWWDEMSWMVRTSTRPSLTIVPWLESPRPLEGDRTPLIETLKAAIGSLDDDGMDGFLDALGEATGTGRAPASAGHDLWMTWPMVREMQASGQRIGAHTVNHPRLSACPPERQQMEITGSRDELARQLGQQPRIFAYPYGDRSSFTPDTARIVEESGFTHAFSFHGGFVRAGRPPDPFDIPRVPVAAGMSQAMIRSMVTIPEIMAMTRPRVALPSILTGQRRS